MGGQTDSSWRKPSPTDSPYNGSCGCTGPYDSRGTQRGKHTQMGFRNPADLSPFPLVYSPGLIALSHSRPPCALSLHVFFRFYFSISSYTVSIPLCLYVYFSLRLPFPVPHPAAVRNLQEKLSGYLFQPGRGFCLEKNRTRGMGTVMNFSCIWSRTGVSPATFELAVRGLHFESGLRERKKHTSM